MKHTYLPEAPPVDDSDFRRVAARSRAAKGSWAELTVAADCVKQGFSISVPFYPEKYDLIVDCRDGRLLRVQVKMAAKGTRRGSIGWTIIKYDYQRGAYRPVVTTKYTEGEFDVLAIVDRDTSEVYYIPAADIDFTKSNFSVSDSGREKYLTL